MATVPEEGGGAPPPAVRAGVRGRLQLYGVPVVPQVAGQPNKRVREGTQTPFSHLTKAARGDTVAAAARGRG